MGDHWKSLANKLGAPGMDAPAAPEPTPPAPRPAPTERPTNPPASSPAASSSAAASHSAHAATVAPVSPTSAAPAPVHASSHATAAPSSPRNKPAPVEEEPVVPAKAKRKSSWDTLTSFFGISSAPEEVDHPAPEVSSSAPGETDDLGSFLGEPSSRSESNKPRGKGATALDTLFGDAPRQELSWEKPAPRRVVDDVSGWDDDDAPVDVVEDDLDLPKASEASIDDEAAEPSESDEARPRRRRRRRRGGRRDGADKVRDEAAPTRGRSAPRDEADDDIEEVEPWADPELVDAVEPGDAWTEPESFESPIEDLDAEPAVMPERRSNRRRRRGRGRSERTEETAATPGEAPREARPPREGRPNREPRELREPREPREVREAREPRDVRDPLDEPAVAERPRREPRTPRAPRDPQAPRTRSARSGSEVPRRELSVVSADTADDEVDSSLAAELEGEDGPNRHPKIPTWADSLEAIISANMENHRRADSHRGGPRGGGRPRGNGGGHSGGHGGGQGGRR